MAVGPRRRFLSQLARSAANKAPDVFMRNKVFVVVREKRTFRIVSPRNDSPPPSYPRRIRFQPHSTFLLLSSFLCLLCMHMILRIRHCIYELHSYSAKTAAGSRLATFYLVPSVLSPLPRIPPLPGPYIPVSSR